MTNEDNGNLTGFMKSLSSSNEDISEYTDADESISAPTEILAEFLSSIMKKDYVSALKYCKLILHYEPNNASAKEFFPLIVEKLHQINSKVDTNNETEDEDDSDDNSLDFSSSDNSSEISEDENEDDTEDDENNNDDDDDDENDVDEDDDDEDDDDDEEIENSNKKNKSKVSSDGEATTGSYSSLEDDEIAMNQLTNLVTKYQVDNGNLGSPNNNKIYDGPIHLDNYQLEPSKTINCLNNLTSSDSESPTDPVSQQTVQLTTNLRTTRITVPNK